MSDLATFADGSIEEFDEAEFISSIADIEYDYDEYDQETIEEEGSGRSLPETPLSPLIRNIDTTTPLGSFLLQVNNFKARLLRDLNRLNRNLRIGLAFLSVG